MTDKKIGYTQGAGGEKSSKRLIAFMMIGTGIILGLGSGVYGLNHVIASPEYLTKTVEYLIGGGVIVAISTTFEGMGNWFKK